MKLSGTNISVGNVMALALSESNDLPYKCL